MDMATLYQYCWIVHDLDSDAIRLHAPRSDQRQPSSTWLFSHILQQHALVDQVVDLSTDTVGRIPIRDINSL